MKPGMKPVLDDPDGTVVRKRYVPPPDGDFTVVAQEVRLLRCGREHSLPGESMG